MKLYLKHNEVKMWSESKIDAPAFQCVDVILTADQLDKLKRNWKTKIIDGKIEQEISHQELSEQQTTEKKNLVDNFKEQVASAKSIAEIKIILNTLITEKYAN